MILGITGGIASGKSTVVRILRELGARVVDCDDLVRCLTDHEPEILNAIRTRFGEEYFSGAGALLRGRLGQLILVDDEARHDLEAILHPRVIETCTRISEDSKSRNEPLAICAPLLIEADMLYLVDRTWLVSCTREQQVERLMQRNGISRELAEQWISIQMPLEEKQKYADDVLDNSVDGIEGLADEISRRWNEIIR
ncbi:dephospho-CoA kinase [bacterium]|nr:dephospho-CoA kinase [bacterium]